MLAVAVMQMLDLLEGPDKVNSVAPEEVQVDLVDQVAQEVHLWEVAQEVQEDQDKIQELEWPLVVKVQTITNLTKCEKFKITFGRFIQHTVWIIITNINR